MSLTMDDMLAIVKPHNDKLIAEACTAELLTALKDIAEGNVPPGFLDGLETESRASFQERVIFWMQERARAAVAKAEGRTP